MKDYRTIIVDYCNRNNIQIQEGPITLNADGSELIVDFIIDDILCVLKPDHLEELYLPQMTNILELYKREHVLIITKDSVKDIFKNSPGWHYQDCLVGASVELFDNPSFPYRDDHPPMFYATKVNNSRTIVEAFYDEKTRWATLKNRTKYVGGFIDVSKLARGLHISKKAQQPSDFPVSFAKHLVESYVTTDQVVDPFAGWGQRCDATVALGKKYLGVDANEKLAKWHKDHGRNVIYDDIRTFHYDDKCSVMTCPPYGDTEIYFEGMAIKSSTEWATIAMENIPNAVEYIFVLDDRDVKNLLAWQKYVVEEKRNRSHFGVNKEPIVVIKQAQREQAISESRGDTPLTFDSVLK